MVGEEVGGDAEGCDGGFDFGDVGFVESGGDTTEGLEVDLVGVGAVDGD